MTEGSSSASAISSMPGAAPGSAPSEATQPGPATPSITVYRDNSALSDTALRGMKAGFVDSAREIHVLKGGTPETFNAASAEAEFAAALALDGIAAPTAPPDPLVAQRHFNFGLPVNPRAGDFDPDLGRFSSMVPTERLSAVKAEAAEWASQMHMPRPLGNAIIERIAELTAAHSNLSDAEREAWVGEQVRAVGPEKFAELRKLAIDALKLATGNKFSARIATDAVLADPFILSMLASHGKTVAEFDRSFPGLRRRAA